jgi:3-oxoacyl-[acyl-carrier-protein] synthase II
MSAMTNKEMVVVTGIGILSPIGVTLAEVTESLKTLRSGIRRIEASPLQRAYPAGVVDLDTEPFFSRLEAVYLDRCQQLAALAGRDALADAGLERLDALGARAGLYYGTVNGGSRRAQADYQQLLCNAQQATNPFSIIAVMHNSGAAYLSIRHGIAGPVHTHGSACASSGAAIGEAARAIRDGYIDIALAGGAEAPLSAAILGGFEGMRALAPIDAVDVARSCKPFSSARSGLVLGEGAAFLVLESATHARQRGARGLAWLQGYGIASDCHHMAVPHAPGQEAAMRQALSDGGLESSQIDYLNAHATGTRGGDVVEASAIRSVFGEGGASVPVSSTKALHGHLLGATSAMESVVALLAVMEGVLPATAYLDQPDPACALNHLTNKSLPGHAVNRAMSLSCGFGGTNVALVFSRYPEKPNQSASESGT